MVKRVISPLPCINDNETSGDGEFQSRCSWFVALNRVENSRGIMSHAFIGVLWTIPVEDWSDFSGTQEEETTRRNAAGPDPGLTTASTWPERTWAVVVVT